MKSKQLKMDLYKGSWGGRRPGCGRKRIHSRGVAHRSREVVNLRTPLHINFKYRASIRNKVCLRLLKRAIMNARSQGLRIVHFSLQSNHIHLIVESENNYILTKGMRSLTVTFAKGLKKGRVQIERYHLQVLKSMRETKNAIQYVLFNKQNHEKGTYSVIDEYSSLMALPNVGKLIANFARKSKMTLRVESRGVESLDGSLSYFLKRAVRELTLT